MGPLHYTCEHEKGEDVQYNWLNSEEYFQVTININKKFSSILCSAFNKIRTIILLKKGGFSIGHGIKNYVLAPETLLQYKIKKGTLFLN